MRGGKSFLLQESTKNYEATERKKTMPKTSIEVLAWDYEETGYYCSQPTTASVSHIGRPKNPLANLLLQFILILTYNICTMRLDENLKIRRKGEVNIILKFGLILL